jgi:hypothetical protein
MLVLSISTARRNNASHAFLRIVSRQNGAFIPKLVMPVLVPGIHVLIPSNRKDVDGGGS